MQVDFSVELGVDDERMELPWASPDGEVRYYDLKRNPELLLNVAEAFDNQELGQFLASANSAGSILETIKCDSWFGEEITEEEKIFGEPCKFGSYVDLIFHQLEPRASLTAHEELAREACELLKRVPPIARALEYWYEASGKCSAADFGIPPPRPARRVKACFRSLLDPGDCRDPGFFWGRTAERPGFVHSTRGAASAS